MQKRLLLVEDDAEVGSFINKGLTEAAFDVTLAFDGVSGLKLATSGSYDLIILDVMLPGMNGLDVCKAIRRENRQVPVLLLTALGASENIVMGLEAEADDYIVKPFKFNELLARIRSLLRRADIGAPPAPITPDNTYQIGDLVVNDVAKTVKRGETSLMLTSTEYRLLLMFIRNQRRVLSRTELLDAVWGVNFDMGTNVVDVYVNYLRKKIDKNWPVKLIHTVIGMGYVMKHGDEDTH
ncbi:response regulator transcription factor [Chryseolinea sp. T2]|uniref:response regulator transcription factor n=1 Tax=Chryseolinea sp. T2 TaxID=3129255 RepID=UPI0030776A9E